MRTELGSRQARPGTGAQARARPGSRFGFRVRAERVDAGADGQARACPVPQLVLVAVCGAYATGAAFGWGSEMVALIMGDFGLSASALLAAASCFWYAKTHRGSRFRPAWFLFGLSSAMAGIGNGIWGWYEVVLRRPVPAASAADLCFLLFAPPALIGLLVLAKRPVTRAGWVCLGLDAWLIGGSLLTLSWSLALAHTGAWQDGNVARAALTLGYPMLDIALVSIALVLHFRGAGTSRPAINTAVSALGLTVLCDALFTLPLLRESYSSGHLLDAGWFAGSLLLAWAPWVGRRDGSVPPAPVRPEAGMSGKEKARQATPHHGRPIASSLAALTPYLSAAVCTLGIIYNSLDGRELDRVVLFTGCTVVLALVVRQGIMLLDNIALTQELAHKENHFRSLVQGSSDVIMIAASTGALRYVSPAAAGVYGRDSDELIGSELAALIHPEDLARVLHEVRRFLAAAPGAEPSTRIECRFRHGAGHWLNIESTVNRYQGGLIFNCRDVTERVRLQAQLQHNASHDPMTDLPNRALFTERVRQALSGRRGGDSEAAVLFIDLDGFKAVNDTVGHQAGDELLIHAAHRLQESVRAGDTAARLGGDEFAALILGEPGPRDPAAREHRIREIADRLRLTLSEPYRVEGNEMRVAASIGVAFAEPGISPADLLRNADLAMYRAKQAGKARVELYAPQMQTDVAQRTERADQLRGALHRGEFALLHQPIVELGNGTVTGVAAQPRWRSAQGILFTPAEFLRADGRAGGRAGGEPQGDRAAEMSRWLLEEAVSQAAARHRAGIEAPVTVRLSAGRVTDRSLALNRVEELLGRHGLPPGSLILELSDSDPRIPLDELEQRLNALRKLGVRIALDGFGSGYAAMAALRRLPLDILCLDRGLVDGIAESVRLRKITAGLLRIAGDLGLMSIADGVDLPDQVTVLRAMGCTHGQGAAFSGALDEHRLRRALARGGFPVPGDGPAPAGADRAAADRSTSDRAAAGPAADRPAPERAGAERVAADRVAAERAAGSRSVVVAGSLPVRRGGVSGPDPVTHPPLRSNSETTVPPT
ncbi:EAL domain-containing protein [Streptomyces armeniacus]|uniref:EAL domain-containing protein n=1 Tax=Streptomyces armeniacus TaxID=83291 RepID=A0A345XRU6_9ACTN|nr:EAL domain-containing protein [Streptomyces armeniacus]